MYNVQHNFTPNSRMWCAGLEGLLLLTLLTTYHHHHHHHHLDYHHLEYRHDHHHNWHHNRKSSVIIRIGATIIIATAMCFFVAPTSLMISIPGADAPRLVATRSRWAWVERSTQEQSCRKLSLTREPGNRLNSSPFDMHSASVNLFAVFDVFLLTVFWFHPGVIWNDLRLKQSEITWEDGEAKHWRGGRSAALDSQQMMCQVWVRKWRSS